MALSCIIVSFSHKQHPFLLLPPEHVTYVVMTAFRVGFVMTMFEAGITFLLSWNHSFSVG